MSLWGSHTFNTPEQVMSNYLQVQGLLTSGYITERRLSFLPLQIMTINRSSKGSEALWNSTNS